jgi:hypothetical protein
MAQVDLTAVSNFLKKVIAPSIQSQLPEQVLLMQNIKENADVEILGNDSFNLTLRVGRHSGISWVNSKTTSNLITGGKDKYAQTKVDAAYGYGTFRIDHKVLTVDDRGSKGSIANILKAESEGLLTDIGKHINRQWGGDGTGQLCLANGAGASSTTLTVDTPSTKYLAEGMTIKIGSGSSVAISTVDSDTQVTLAAARTWSDNDVVKMTDADGNAASEMMGMRGFADDGTIVATLQNIARSSNSWWKTPAAQLNVSVAALAELDMIKIYLNAKTNAVGKPKYAWFLSTDQFIKYGSLLTSMKKTADTKEVLNGGWMGLSFMDGVPVVPDDDIQAGEGYLMDRNMLTWAKLADLDFIPGTDNGVLARVAGTTLYEATAFVYGNLMIKNTRCLGAFRNKTAP